MIVTLDGETIVKLKPVFGYLHRNHEKLGENTTYLASMPYTDRLDYLNSMTNNWAYAVAVEKLAGLAVPERAEYVRVILAELTRLLNHSCSPAPHAGLRLQRHPLMYAFREREKILDLFESLSGSRMMCNYQRFGGCRVDPSADWLAGAQRLTDGYGAFLDEFEALLTGNEILMARTQGVGRLSSALAISAGVTGPVLRATGVAHDLPQGRRLRGLPTLRFPRAARATTATTYDRYMIRIPRCASPSRSSRRRWPGCPAARSWTRRPSSVASGPRRARPTAASRVPRARLAST